MERQSVIDNARSEADARLAFGVAAGTVVAYLVFAAWPVFVTDPRWLFGLDPIWAVAGYFTVLLGPLAAGMAGYLSVLALWTKGAELSTRARRLHLVTMLIVAGLLVAMVSPLGSEVVSGWLGD